MEKMEPIIIEQSIDCPVEEVWAAITEPEIMRQWYFENIPDFKAEVGFRTRFNISADSRDFLHNWEVTEVILNKLIAYKWYFDGINGESFSIFELREVDGNTHLKLTCIGLESFPQDIPEFSRESCIGGWNYFIKNRLLNFMSY